MWVVSKMVNPMDKENLIILSPNLMILNTIMDNGKMGYQMEMPMHIITMGMFIRETFKKVKDKALDHMFSIKFIDIKVNGEIILSQEKESFSEMVNYFFKVCFKMD